MIKIKKMLALLLAIATLLSLAACSGKNGSSENPTGSAEDPSASSAGYTVELKTQGGMALSDVDVYVYSDKTLADLKQFGKTDINGKLTVQMPQSGEYVAVISGLPKGYQVESYYAFTGNTASITVTTELLPEVPSGAALGVGDVMFDFSVVTPDGTTVKLSEMLKEKDMVLLNFWYTTCTWCVKEFPYMQQAYEQYQDKIGIIALDPMEENAAIKAFQENMGLTFPMAACSAAWSNTFNISGYPTSIVVDRYGVICLVEAGGMPSIRPFISIFENFSGDGYAQKLYASLDELITAIKPTYTMDTSENIAAVMNSGEIQVAYRPETKGENAEYAWPFVIGEKNGEACLYASNQGIDDSYAILYADVELKAGQALGFDYLASSERGSDQMFVLVNGENMYTISGYNEEEQWLSCYPLVADHDGVYELALCYIKDGDGSEGDDTVYIKNLRITTPDTIDAPTYLPCKAAVSADGFEYTYADIVMNETDGFYHVGTADGPLLLADLLGATDFNSEVSVWELNYTGNVILNGHDYTEDISPYASIASNSAAVGKIPVDEKLAECLKATAQTNGFEGTENEWLKMCIYYQAYGTNGEQLADPTIGLSTSNPLTATQGKNVDTNFFYYDRILVPRGLMAKFVPSRSGVYRITSRTENGDDLEGWIFDDNGAGEREALMTYEHDERMWNDSANVSMVYYMEAGKPYYIDIAFWDVYGTGYIYYDIEYIGATYDHFRQASPGYFTYNPGATGDAMYYLIAGGIDVVLKSDGYYYEDLGKDANGKQLYGSKLYCDFTGITGIFDTPIATTTAYNADGSVQKDENGNPVMIKGMIEKGGFDFSKTEDDLYILAIMANHDNDPAATDAYLRDFWGDDYESNAKIYKLQDVLAGIYHGEGEDMTAQISEYLSKIITSGKKELIGCVPVDETLAAILQKLLDKYTFENVDNSWIKVCYYYDHLGPNT